MLVVLPAPFTPTIIITVGVDLPMSSGFSSGASNSANTSRSSSLTCCGVSTRAARTFLRNCSSTNCVAGMPASARINAVSSSSYSASSTRLPPNRTESPEPVLRKP